MHGDPHVHSDSYREPGQPRTAPREYVGYVYQAGNKVAQVHWSVTPYDTQNPQERNHQASNHRASFTSRNGCWEFRAPCSKGSL